jgi:hypothetical protein
VNVVLQFGVVVAVGVGSMNFVGVDVDGSAVDVSSCVTIGDTDGSTGGIEVGVLVFLFLLVGVASTARISVGDGVLVSVGVAVSNTIKVGVEEAYFPRSEGVAVVSGFPFESGLDVGEDVEVALGEYEGLGDSSSTVDVGVGLPSSGTSPDITNLTASTFNAMTSGDPTPSTPTILIWVALINSGVVKRSATECLSVVSSPTGGWLTSNLSSVDHEPPLSFDNCNKKTSSSQLSKKNLTSKSTVEKSVSEGSSNSVNAQNLSCLPCVNTPLQMATKSSNPALELPRLFA